jgi:hypothetical protein
MPFDPALWWNEGAFIYLGRMGDNKGVEHVLIAWCSLKEELADRCPDLWLVGGTPAEIETVRRKVNAASGLSGHEVAGRVRWWGYLNEEGISALFLKACALIMHSSYEPGGRVILEAMAQGLPVIATPHGFALDLVEDWQTGFIVPYGDNDMLRRRMEHFAYTPMLSISLGIAARATAQAALNDWDFFRTHESIYLQAISGAEPPVIGTSHSLPSVIRNPLPHGLVGRYPFPVVAPDTADAVTAAASVLEIPSSECVVELAPLNGRSLVWYVHGAGATVVVKHSYTTYVRRPLWDRTYNGPLVWSARTRRKREVFASKLPGFATILAEDELRGLNVLPYLPASASCTPLELVRAALGPLSCLWRAPVANDSGHSIGAVDQWWRDRSTAPWRFDGMITAETRCSSARIAWAEMWDKVLHKDIRIPVDMAQQLEAIAIVCEDIAGREADTSFLCYQHGDYSNAHVRTSRDGICLIDGERCAPGWWGRDAAFVLMKAGEGLSDNWWDTALELICDTPDQRRLVLLWVVIEAVNETARIAALWPGRPTTGASQWWTVAVSRLKG